MAVYQVRVRVSSKHKKTINNKLRWLASEIDFKLLNTGFPIAHAFDFRQGKPNLKIPIFAQRSRAIPLIFGKVGRF